MRLDMDIYDGQIESMKIYYYCHPSIALPLFRCSAAGVDQKDLFIYSSSLCMLPPLTRSFIMSLSTSSLHPSSGVGTLGKKQVGRNYALHGIQFFTFNGWRLQRTGQKNNIFGATLMSWIQWSSFCQQIYSPPQPSP